MKRLWLAAGILAALLAACLMSAGGLADLGEEINGLLSDAEEKAEMGEWEEAGDLTGRAYQIWEEHDIYLHVLLRHADTDEVYTGFRQVRELLECREAGEYSAANAALMARIQLIYEAERPTVENFF